MRTLPFDNSTRTFAIKFLLRRKFVATREEAEDITQDAMLRAWEHRRQFRGDSKFSTWFMRIVVNSALMRLRYSSQKVSEHSQAITEADWMAAPVRKTDPLLRAHLFRCLGQLSFTEQKMLLLTYIYGWTRQEIADTEGMSFGTVKARVHRARLKLKRIIENHASAVAA